MNPDLTTTAPPTGSAQLTGENLHDFAVRWYQALDRHDDVAAIHRYLVADDLTMVFPEVTTHGVAAFDEWYDRVTHTFFDEEHLVRSTEVVSASADEAELTVLVTWRASTWNAPAPRSARLDFDAFQRWTVVPGADGPLVKRYVVETFTPNPGSAPL